MVRARVAVMQNLSNSYNFHNLSDVVVAVVQLQYTHLEIQWSQLGSTVLADRQRLKGSITYTKNITLIPNGIYIYQDKEFMYERSVSNQYCFTMNPNHVVA